MHMRIAPGVVQIDTRLGGYADVTAGYLVEGPAPVLVETGSQSSVAVLLAALTDLGLGATDLAGVAVTHIHLDHAGGVGDVAQAFPEATVYVHERGARHLVDPTRLVASAATVYGDLLDSLYGRLTPTEAERLHVLHDGDTIELGNGDRLVCIDSPGHAKHHLSLLHTGSGLLFCGDAVGIRLPKVGVLRPAAPPPDWDLDQAVRSLERFREHRPSGLALAHFGLLPGDPVTALDEAIAMLHRWGDVAEAAVRDGRDVAEAFAEAFAADFDGIAAEDRALAETLNGVHSNAEGFRRWLAQRGTGSVAPGPAGGGTSTGHGAGTGTPVTGHAHPHPHPHA